MQTLVTYLILASLLLVGCGGSKPKGEVTVYVAAPLSGFQANGGQTVVGGVRLAAEEINRAGGLLGYAIKVIALDDESDSDVAVKVAEQVRQAVTAMGTAAVQALLDGINGTPAPRDEFIFRPELVVRASTGPVPA